MKLLVAGTSTVPNSLNKRCGWFLAAAACALLLGWSAAPAHAAAGAFCPPTWGTVTWLNPYGSINNSDRCAHGYHTSYNIIEYHISRDTTEKCAVLKTNPDGGGGNVGGLAAACATGTTTAVQTPVGLAGYATGINKGSLWHDGFFGYLAYGL